VAPNLDHIAHTHTKPGTRSKEGNNVFGCENGTPTIQRQESPHDLANERRMMPRGKGKTKRAKKGGHEGRIIIRHISKEQ
jgi:hypothetical protein